MHLCAATLAPPWLTVPAVKRRVVSAVDLAHQPLHLVQRAIQHKDVVLANRAWRSWRACAPTARARTAWPRGAPSIARFKSCMRLRSRPLIFKRSCWTSCSHTCFLSLYLLPEASWTCARPSSSGAARSAWRTTEFQAAVLRMEVVVVVISSMSGEGSSAGAGVRIHLCLRLGRSVSCSCLAFISSHSCLITWFIPLEPLSLCVCVWCVCRPRAASPGWFRTSCSVGDASQALYYSAAREGPNKRSPSIITVLLGWRPHYLERCALTVPLTKGASIHIHCNDTMGRHFSRSLWKFANTMLGRSQCTLHNFLSQICSYNIYTLYAGYIKFIGMHHRTLMEYYHFRLNQY